MEISDFIEHFTEQFENMEVSLIRPETVFRDLDGWDSLVALSVMLMIDEEYDVHIAAEEMRKSNTIEDLFKIVMSHQ